MNSDFLSDGFAITDGLSTDLLNNVLAEIPYALSLLREFRADTNDRHEDIAVSVTHLSQLVAATELEKVARKFATTLIGKVPELMQAQLVVRKSGASSIPFHVDGKRTVTSLDEMPFCQLVVGIALTDIGEKKCGNLKYKSGSHHFAREYLYLNFNRLVVLGKAAAFDEIYALAKELETTPSIVSCPKGSIFAMHSLLVHGVDENQHADRPVWYFRYGNPSKKGKDGFKSAFPCEDWPIMCD